MELDFFSQGKEYISASRAAKKTGYASDYIGQLCRSGKIPGKLVERTWYVDLESLLAHKRTRQLGKPRRAPQLETPKQKEAAVLKIQAAPVELIAPTTDFKLEYAADAAPLLPPIREKLAFDSLPQGARAIPMKTYATLAATTLFVIGATLALPHDFAKQSEKLALQATAAEAAALSIFGALSDSATFLAESFRNLQNLAFGTPVEEAPNLFASKVEIGATPVAPEAPARALTTESPALGATYTSNLKSELESYINTRLAELASPEPRFVYSPSFNTTVLREDILTADTRPTVTRQSTSDVDHSSRAITALANGGTLTDITITGGTFANMSSGSFASLGADTGSFASLTFGNASGTAATTTSFFATTASSTNLFASLASFGNATSTTLAITGDGAGLIFSGSGNHDITASGGTLRIGANTVIGNILPLDATISIGAVGNRFNKIYADEVNANTIVGTISGGNVSAESMRINSDNATADAEDSYLEFERGSLNPNALMAWDSTNKRFTLNAPLALTGGIGNGDFLATGSTTLQDFTFVRATGTAATTTNLYTAGETILAGVSGNVAIGTTTANPLGFNSSSRALNIQGDGTLANGGGRLLLSNNRSAGSLASGDEPGRLVFGMIANGNGSVNDMQIAQILARTAGSGGARGFGGVLSFYTKSDNSENFLERMVIDQSGNMGIGTTTPNNKLDIFSSTKAALSFTGGATAGQWTVGYDVSNGRFAIASSTVLGTIDRLVINGSGNVGIGTTTPQAVLHTLGQIRSSVANDTTAFRITDSNNANAISFYRDTNQALTIDVGSASRALVVNASGNVGVSTSSPYAKLSVTNTGTGPSFLVEDSSSADATPFIIDTNGNVGIGTTNPDVKLQINGATDGQIDGKIKLKSNRTGWGDITSMFQTTAGGSTALDGLGISVDSGFISLSPGGGTAMTLLHGGSVGIGTTNPGKFLQLNSGAPIVRFSEGGVFRGDIGISDAGSNAIFTGDADNTLGIRGDGGVNLGASATVAMSIVASGNVGIGTTTPQRNLSIFSGSSPALQLYSTGSGGGNSDGYQVALDSSNNAYLWNFENTKLFIATNNTERITVAASGEVGIGTTSPMTKFQIDFDSGSSLTGTTAFGGFHMQSTGINDDFVGMTFGGPVGSNFGTHAGVVAQIGNGYGTRLHFMTTSSFNSGMQQRMMIDESGNVGIGTTTPTATLEIIGQSAEFQQALSVRSSAGAQRILIGIGSTGERFIESRTNGGTATDLVFNRNGGNIGIGTTNPGGLLHTWSNTDNDLIVEADADNSDEDDNARLVLRQDGNLVNGILGTMGSTLQYTGAISNAVFLEAKDTAGNSPLQFVTGGTTIGGTNGTARMSILSSGNVGIGTTTPLYKLVVAGGTDNTSGAVVFEPGSSGQNRTLKFGNASGIATIDSLLTSNSAAGNLSINPSGGNIGIGTTTPTWALNSYSATAPQLALSAGAGVAQWAFRNAGGNLYLATTTVAGTATTSTSALSINGSTGAVSIGNPSATTAQLVVSGGSGGNPMITLERTVGATITYSWSLAGGGLAFNSETDGFTATNIFGDSGMNQLYVGQKATITSGQNTRNSLISGTTVGSSMGSDLSTGNLIIQGNLGTGAGTPGDILFTTGTVLGSGSTAQTGTTRLTIKNDSGNIGIGTTTPNAKFVINNQSGVATGGESTLLGDMRIIGNSGGVQSLSQNGGLEFKAAASSNGYGFRIINADLGNGSTPLVFQSRNNSSSWSEVMRINNSTTNNGFVGIGTTSPNSLLSVRTGNASSAVNTGVAQFGVSPGSSSAGVELGTYTGGYGMIQGISFTAGTSNSLVINPFGGTTIFNVASGNVGIGTTTVGAKLHVFNGNGLIERNDASPLLSLRTSSGNTFNPEVFLGEDTASGGSLTYDATNNVFNINTGTGGPAALTPRISIPRDGGNVGIGTTNPSQQLTVAQGVAFMGLANGAGTAYLCTTLATGVISTSTTACNPSSLRYKENVADLSYGLDTVLNLRAVSYDYKPELLVEGHQIGFIAEEMYEQVPEIVGLDQEGNPNNIDYAKLVSVLTRAIQEIAAITGVFKDNLIAWLGDAANGLEKLFAKEVHTEQLCVKKSDGSEICVTGDQLASALGGAGTVVGGSSGASGSGSTLGSLEIVPEDNSTGTSTDETASSTPETITSENGDESQQDTITEETQEESQTSPDEPQSTEQASEGVENSEG